MYNFKNIYFACRFKFSDKSRRNLLSRHNMLRAPKRKYKNKKKRVYANALTKQKIRHSRFNYIAPNAPEEPYP